MLFLKAYKSVLVVICFFIVFSLFGCTKEEPIQDTTFIDENTELALYSLGTGTGILEKLSFYIVGGQDFSGQGGYDADIPVGERGGSVELLLDREYLTFRYWDLGGHWLEWKLEVPEDDYYYIGICYATNHEGVTRSFMIDSQLPYPSFVEIKVPVTGGFGQEKDHWSHSIIASDEGEPIQVFFKKGTRILRLENTAGPDDVWGMNIALISLINVNAELIFE